jgi:putative flippase GtrA
VDLSQNPLSFKQTLWKKLRSKVGVRFTRFIPVAIASLIASQVALIIFNHVLLRGNAGIAGFLAAVIGAAVSYVLSRWAWERKGRPDLLRETLPFWAVSVCMWIILAWANKLGVYLVHEMALHKGWKKVIVENGTYFAVNCVTFVVRFLIFHYWLFAERGTAGSAGSGPESESLTLTPTGDEPTR